MSVRTSFNRILILCLSAVVIASCGKESSRPDPKTAYAALSEAANKGDGGQVYDLLDHGLQVQMDTNIQLQLSQRASMSPDQKALWDKIGDLKGRAAFAKLFELNKGAMTARFQGGTVVKVDTVIMSKDTPKGSAEMQKDTLYALSIKHPNNTVDGMAFRWQNDKYVFCGNAPAPTPTISPVTPKDSAVQPTPKTGSSAPKPQGENPTVK